MRARGVIALALALATILAGCATTAGYDRMLDEWIGETEYSLVSVWGQPDRQRDAGMGKIMIYDRARQVQRPTVIAPGATPRSPIMAYGGGTETRRCRTEFWVHEGRVINWRHEGDDCRQ